MKSIVFISIMISVIVTSVTEVLLTIGMKMVKSPNLLIRGFGRIIVVIILLITIIFGIYLRA